MKDALDLSLLIEHHKKEIWEWKKKESDWIKTDHELMNAKKIIDELTAKIVEQVSIIHTLEKARNDLAEELKNK